MVIVCTFDRVAGLGGALGTVDLCPAVPDALVPVVPDVLSEAPALVPGGVAGLCLAPAG